MIDKLEELISFSNHLADESEIIIKKYFRQKMNVESKSDQSPINAKMVSNQFKDTNLLIIDGGKCNIGLESTLVRIIKKSQNY